MKRTFLVVILAGAFSAQAQFGGFDLGKALDIGKKVVQAKETSEFTEEQEIALGEGITAGFLGASPLHPDARLQAYVNRVGKWVALHSERPDLPWTFGVIDTETINAFAMPGGNVIVSSGLLKRLASESELAGVLAHEVAHVVRKHQLSAIQSGAWGDLGKSLASEAVSSRIARSGGGVVGQQLKSWGADKGLELVKNGAFLRPLDRSMEYEADRMAIVIATRSGYDPFGLVGALQMLAQVKGDADGASVLSTHPPASERLAEVEKIMPGVERYATHPQLEGRFKQVVGTAK